MSWLSEILRDVGILPPKEQAAAAPQQGFTYGGGLSFLTPALGQIEFSEAPSLGQAVGGGTYSTGIQVQQPDLPPGVHMPLTYYSPGPIPAIVGSQQHGLLPGPGGNMLPYTTNFVGPEAAFPSAANYPNLMQRVQQIGIEDTRASQKFSFPDAVEGPFAQQSGWTNKTDEEVGAFIAQMSGEDRTQRMPGWITSALLEQTEAQGRHATMVNEQMAAGSLSHARTTTELMGLLTGALGMSEYADVTDRAKGLGERVWSNFRDRGYDTSTAYASASRVAEQAKDRMLGQFFDRQLTRRIGAMQMGNNIMQQAFMGVQRTPPNPMALAQIIYGQVASGMGQQQPEAPGTGTYLGSMLGGGMLAMGMRALTGWLMP
jgi:hypothetical protein